MKSGVHPPLSLSYPSLIRNRNPFTTRLTERVFQSPDGDVSLNLPSSGGFLHCRHIADKRQSFKMHLNHLVRFENVLLFSVLFTSFLLFIYRARYRLGRYPQSPATRRIQELCTFTFSMISTFSIHATKDELH